MTKARFEITGEWLGYRSSQDHVVHREFTKDRTYVAAVEAIGGSITFTDGTRLILAVRKMDYREVARPPILGYSDLIRDCISYKVSSVDALVRVKAQADEPDRAEVQAQEAGSAKTTGGDLPCLTDE